MTNININTDKNINVNKNIDENISVNISKNTNTNVEIFSCVFAILSIQILISMFSYRISKKRKILKLILQNLEINTFRKLILFLIITLFIELILIKYILSNFKEKNKIEFYKRFIVFIILSIFNGLLLSFYDNEKKVRSVIIQLFILWFSSFILSLYLSFTNKFDIKKVRFYYITMFTIISVLELSYILIFYKMNKTFNIISIILVLISTLFSTDDLFKKKNNCINGSFQFYTEIIQLFQRLYVLK